MKRPGLVCMAFIAFLAPALRAAELSVFAAASLTDALTEAASAYEPASRDKLRFSFAGSNTLARQIKEGAPADIFFCADEIQMNHLVEAGLIDSSTRLELLSNSLVVVVPKDGPAELTPAALAEKSIKRVALADPQSVPAGLYAREYLKKQRLWEAVEFKVVPTENVRAALAAVEAGNVDAGIVYKTDAAISNGVKIAYEVPAAEGPRIVYPVAVVRETRNAEASKRFLAYLRSEPARTIFRRFGFIVLP